MQKKRDTDHNYIIYVIEYYDFCAIGNIIQLSTEIAGNEDVKKQ